MLKENTYKEEIMRAMEYLAEDPRVLFLGQSVAYTGNSIYRTLVNVMMIRSGKHLCLKKCKWVCL